MSRLKFTIVTPSYNQGRFLGQTIKSVVDQKGDFDLEYFIFDGGSTDNSVKIIKKYAQKYPFIKWVSQKDKGQVDVLNQGFKRATGDIVAYLNSDDYYLPNSFQKVVEYFTKNPQKMWVVGQCKVSKKSLRWTFILKHIWPIDRFKIALGIFNTINQPAVFLTIKLINKVGKINDIYHLAFDYDYWLRCNQISLPGRIKQDLAVFRVHSSSKSNLGFKHQFEEDYAVIKSHSDNRLIHFIHFLAQKITILCYKYIK